MPTSRTYARCRKCRGHRDEVGVLSKRGYCSICGPEISDAWNDDLHYHKGERFKQWRRSMAASVGAVLVDDVLEAE